MILISPKDDPARIVDLMLETGYAEEFCVAINFDPPFIARLMDAGFLVMSASAGGGRYILLPKLHLVRSVLFFENLHVKKSIRRFLPRYELRFDGDFDRILDRCVTIHGDDWLTPPLVDALRAMRAKPLRGFASEFRGGAGFGHDARNLPTARDGLSAPGSEEPRNSKPAGAGSAKPVSFGVYRDGELRAGEFGVVSGRVYTSYSGYYDEDNAGTVQMILTARFLRERGFAFFDLGMPLDYKYDLGARDVSPRRFVELFRGENHAG
jgi:Leu/Phe-tRNA-protein transferase